MSVAVASTAISYLEAQAGRLRTAARALYAYRPRYRDRRFWLIQVLLVLIAVVHIEVERWHLLEGPTAHGYGLFLVPISLFFVPVVYAALTFGLAGGLATAAWSTVLAVPNLVLFHDTPERLGELVQLAMVDAIAVLAGQRVDRELHARRQAEAAGVALRAYAAHELRVQEEERKRIAQELHDETLQKVVLVCRQLDAADAAVVSDTARIAVNEARRTAEQIAAELRDFARTLRPPSLEDLGLVSAVRRLLTDLGERTGAAVTLDIPATERRSPPEVELAAFRIAQEALRNVERHAQATHVRVTLTFGRSEVCVGIVDDGRGFAVRARYDPAGGHLGLLGLRERAETFGGKLDVVSEPGRGTTVSATIPCAVGALH